MSSVQQEADKTQLIDQYDNEQKFLQHFFGFNQKTCPLVA